MKALRIVFAAFMCIAGLCVGKSAVGATEGGLTPLNQCLAEKHSLSVLFLVDTSQSLKTTDKTSDRVAGLQSAVSTLQTLKSSSTTSGKPVDVFLEFLDFGSAPRRTFPDRPQWAPLVDDPSLLTALSAGYAKNNNSEDTDYVAALEPWLNPADPARPASDVGALETLAKAPAGSCRLLVWFTDGKFDIDFQHSAKQLHWVSPPLDVRSNADEPNARKLGVDLLCKPGGFADRLRTGDISSGEGAEVAVVGLGSLADFDLIRSVALGQGTGGACGSQPSRGLFLPASDVSQLVLQLRQTVLGPDDGSPTGATGIGTCQKGQPSCDVSQGVIDADYPFELSQGLTAFNLLTLFGDPRVKTSIIAPDGSENPLNSGQDVSLPNGVHLTILPLSTKNGGFQVNGTLPTGTLGWAGQWKVRFRTNDPVAAKNVKNNASIYVFGSLQARLRNSDQIARKGRDAKLIVELVSAAGQPATDTAFRAGSDLQVLVNGVVLRTPQVNADGSFEYVYPVPADFAANSLDVSAVLKPVIQLAPDSPPVALPEWSGSLGSIALAPLPKYPLIDPPAAIATTLDQKTKHVTTTIRLDSTAPASGGCVSLLSLTAPTSKTVSGAAQVEVRDGDRVLKVGDPCAVKLADGDAKNLTLEVSIDGMKVAQDSVLEGAVQFSSTSAIDATQTQTFPTFKYSARVLPIFQTVDHLGTTVWLFVISILLPILLLYLFNWRSARLDLGALALVELPVLFAAGRLRRSEDGVATPLNLQDEDMQIGHLPEAGRYRTMDAGQIRLRGRWPWNPFSDVYADATAEGASLVVSNRGSLRKGQVGRLDAALARTWIFETHEVPRIGDDDVVEPIAGSLTLLVPTQPDLARRQLGEALEAIDERIDGVVKGAAVSAPKATQQPTETAVPTVPEPVNPNSNRSPLEDPFGTDRDRLPFKSDPFGDSDAPTSTPNEPTRRERSRADKPPKASKPKKSKQAPDNEIDTAPPIERDLPF